MTKRYTATVYPEIILGDRGSLPLIARLTFAYDEDAGPEDIVVVSLTIDISGMPIVCPAELREWIVKTADWDELYAQVERARAAERDDAAEDKRRQRFDDAICDRANARVAP